MRAAAAIRAAKNWWAWGPFAASRFAAARGVPPAMLAAAVSLETRRRVRRLGWGEILRTGAA